MTRRDNGLPGEDWRLLTDLTPPLADHVLEILRDEGIAAYAAPSTGPTGAYLETQAHERPLDEVFVGQGELDRARTVLDDVLPRLRAEIDDETEASPRVAAVSTDDDVWAGIVAAYSAPSADPVARWSASEDTDTTTEAPATGDALPAPADDTAPTSPRRAATGFEDIEAEVEEARAERAERTAAAGPADDPHDHYIPPPPPPLPEGDVVTKAAWVGIIGGPLWLILATILGWGPGGLPGLAAVLAFVAGFITLVARMGDDRDEDDDDGAVV
jgi:hypothetical protein